jgi:endogenous inhibitor of DNA gyrase (YacG/DUF329 family)
VKRAKMVKLTTEEAEKANVVVSMRVLDMPSYPVPGSTVDHCADCGHAVWRSPSSPHGPKILCTQCAGVELQFDANPNFGVSDKGMEELQRWIKGRMH